MQLYVLHVYGIHCGTFNRKKGIFRTINKTDGADIKTAVIIV